VEIYSSCVSRSGSLTKHDAFRLATRRQEVIAREGYDPVFGARRSKRVIQRAILDALSLEILSGRCQRGDKIQVMWTRRRTGALVFERA